MVHARRQIPIRSCDAHAYCNTYAYCNTSTKGYSNAAASPNTAAAPVASRSGKILIRSLTAAS